MFRPKLTRENATFICIFIHIVYLVFGSALETTHNDDLKLNSEQLLNQDKLIGAINLAIPTISENCLNGFDMSPLTSVQSSGSFNHKVSSPLSLEENQLEDKQCAEASQGSENENVFSATSTNHLKNARKNYGNMYFQHLRDLKRSGKTYKRRAIYRSLSKSDKLTYLQMNPPITGSVMPDEHKILKRRVRPTMISERTKLRHNIEEYDVEDKKLLDALDSQDLILKKLRHKSDYLKGVVSLYDLVIKELKAKQELMNAKKHSELGIPDKGSDKKSETNIEDKSTPIKAEIEELTSKKHKIDAAQTELNNVLMDHANIKILAGSNALPSNMFQTHSLKILKLEQIFSGIVHDSSGVSKVGQHENLKGAVSYLRVNIPSYDEHISTAKSSDDLESTGFRSQLSSHYRDSKSLNIDMGPEKMSSSVKITLRNPNKPIFTSRWSGTIKGPKIDHRSANIEYPKEKNFQEESNESDLYYACLVDTHMDDDDSDEELLYNRLCEKARVLQHEIRGLEEEDRRKRQLTKIEKQKNAALKWKERVIAESKKKQSTQARLQRNERDINRMRKELAGMYLHHSGRNLQELKNTKPHEKHDNALTHQLPDPCDDPLPCVGCAPADFGTSSRSYGDGKSSKNSWVAIVLGNKEDPDLNIKRRELTNTSNSIKRLSRYQANKRRHKKLEHMD
ncbi:putative signal peptide protein [Cryptosporidium canis]|uniref:Signal peptide protein n=1 Tax=Cryptosporidium canis TaxID=195482 RepID=A0A9D5DDV4_9CRYT|nr:putative signal peptide protein [Cryptosporidium canis]